MSYISLTDVKLSEEDVTKMLLNLDSAVQTLTDNLKESNDVFLSQPLAITSDKRVSLTIDVTEIECDGTTKLGVKLRGYKPVDWDYCSETVMVNDLSVLKGAVVGLVAKLIIK